MLNSPVMVEPFCAILPVKVVWLDNLDEVVKKLQLPAMFTGGVVVEVGVVVGEPDVMPQPSCIATKLARTINIKHEAPVKNALRSGCTPSLRKSP
jgi:hypothetical protein